MFNIKAIKNKIFFSRICHEYTNNLSRDEMDFIRAFVADYPNTKRSVSGPRLNNHAEYAQIRQVAASYARSPLREKRRS